MTAGGDGKENVLKSNDFGTFEPFGKVERLKPIAVHGRNRSPSGG